MDLADFRGLAVYLQAALERPERPELHGIHFSPSDADAEAAASNGTALALLSIPGAAIEGTLPDPGITLPALPLVFPLDTGGTVHITLGENCRLEYGGRIERAPPAATEYPAYRSLLPEPGTETACSSFHFGARELRLAAVALEYFAFPTRPAHDTATFFFHRPSGPHEIRLVHRKDVRLLFMPCRYPDSPPDPSNL